MRIQLPWPVVVVLVAALPSCLFLDDFRELEGTGGEAPTSTGSTTSGPASTSSSGSPSSSASTSSAGGTTTGTGDGGQGGAGGFGGGGGSGPSPLERHGFVHRIYTDNEDCIVEVTDLETFNGDTIIAGVTTAVGAEACGTVAPVGDIAEQAEPGESVLWIVRLSDQSRDEDAYALRVVPSEDQLHVAPVRLAAVGNKLYAGFSVPRSTEVENPFVIVRDITAPPPDSPEELEDIENGLSGDLDAVLTDLFGSGGRVYATGTIDGYGGTFNCFGALGSYDREGFVWSTDGDTCPLGTFGTDTKVVAGSPAGAGITLAGIGVLEFGDESPCSAEGDDKTLHRVDVQSTSAEVLPPSCQDAVPLGRTTYGLSNLPASLAANEETQIAAVTTNVETALIVRDLTDGGADDAKTSFVGAPRRLAAFATPGGTLGAVGRYEGALSCGDREFGSASGEAGFFVTFDGQSQTSFVLDAAGEASVESLTAALGTEEGVWIAGQWQEGLGEELGFSGSDLNPVGTAAFVTLLQDL